jgi:hypothetical protein
MYKGCQHQPEGASVVYWIHKPEHTDITKEGYVGITSNKVQRRWVDHKSASRSKTKNNCKIVNKAIRKHKDLIYEVVLVADTREYCERIERLLRPTNCIGWNIAIGGMSVDTMMGGIATRKRWIQHWINNPTEAAERWWESERLMLKKQATTQRKEKKPLPWCKPRKSQSNNTSGDRGVTWFQKLNKWRAQIGITPYVITIGYYEDKEDAKQQHQEAQNIKILWKKNLILKNEAITRIKSLKKQIFN